MDETLRRKVRQTWHDWNKYIDMDYYLTLRDQVSPGPDSTSFIFVYNEMRSFSESFRDPHPYD